jgi:diguanylate cyclase (GGDEF)-like protein
MVQAQGVTAKSSVRSNGRRQAGPAGKRQAGFDPLTGLADRAGVVSYLDARPGWMGGKGQTCVLVVDLDHFKLVNDSRGHLAGDMVLQAAARRLRSVARGQDLVARLSGDEFAVVATGIGDQAGALAYAERLRQRLEARFRLRWIDAILTASVGVARGDAATPPGHLLAQAEAAMHRAKERGGGRVEVFDPSLQERAHMVLATRLDLSQALAKGELWLAYQPVTVLATGMVVGYEALSRWEVPGQVPVPPSKFIPLAEESGLIGSLGGWVLREAVSQLGAWHRGGWRHLSVSINVSARQLEDEGLVAEAVEVCRSAGVAPSALWMELTESALMDDLDASAHFLAEARSAGVRVALDDFGTGYSSLNRIKQFLPDLIKVDQSFVGDLARDPTDVAILTAVQAMASALGTPTLAEGVERAEQAAVLRSLGYRMAQGYLFGPPVPAAGLRVRCSTPATIRRPPSLAEVH